MRSADIAYEYQDGLYLNLTNRCPTACVFCVKKEWRWSYRGFDLKLAAAGEPTAKEAADIAIARLKEKPFRELVYCGYGEPTYRLPELVNISRRVRRAVPGTLIRINTVGLGDLIWHADIAPELLRAVDAVSVSLNTADPKQWKALLKPRPEFREAGFPAVLRFISRCAALGLKTTVTAVELPGVDVWAVKQLARKLGAEFRLRPRLDQGLAIPSV